MAERYWPNRTGSRGDIREVKGGALNCDLCAAVLNTRLVDVPLLSSIFGAGLFILTFKLVSRTAMLLDSLLPELQPYRASTVGH